MHTKARNLMTFCNSNFTVEILNWLIILRSNAILVVNYIDTILEMKTELIVMKKSIGIRAAIDFHWLFSMFIRMSDLRLCQIKLIDSKHFACWHLTIFRVFRLNFYHF